MTYPSAAEALNDPRWHVPQVARRSDGRWGVFCASCSHHRGDYVNPCMKFPQAEWPAALLREDRPMSEPAGNASLIIRREGRA